MMLRYYLNSHNIPVQRRRASADRGNRLLADAIGHLSAVACNEATANRHFLVDAVTSIFRVSLADLLHSQFDQKLKPRFLQIVPLKCRIGH